jgi:transposase
VIVDHDNRRILDVLENREKATVVAYLRKKKLEGLLANVEEVTYGSLVFGCGFGKPRVTFS